MKRLLTFTLIVILSLAFAFCLNSCANEGNYYDKASVDSLVSNLETALEAKNLINETAIAELTAEYEEKVAALEKTDSDNILAYQAFTAEYNAKLEELKTKHNTEIQEIKDLIAVLQNADKTNAEAIAVLKDEYREIAEELAADVTEQAERITALETQIQNLSNESTNESSALTTQMQELLQKMEELKKLRIWVVTFDVAGGNGAVPAQATMDGGKIIEPTAPTLEGYTFEGWYYGEDEWVFKDNSVTENIMLRAEWSINVYTVIFDVTEGNEEIPVQLINHGQKATEPSAPTRSGYVFEGWYDGSEKWNFEENLVTENIILQANWKSTELVNVDFDGFGGKTYTEAFSDVNQNFEITVTDSNLEIVSNDIGDYLSVEHKATSNNFNMKFSQDTDYRMQFSLYFPSVEIPVSKVTLSAIDSSSSEDNKHLIIINGTSLQVWNGLDGNNFDTYNTFTQIPEICAGRFYDFELIIKNTSEEGTRIIVTVTDRTSGVKATAPEFFVENFNVSELSLGFTTSRRQFKFAYSYIDYIRIYIYTSEEE